MFRFCLITCVFALTTSSGPASADEPLSIRGKTMGSYYSIIIDGADQSKLTPLKKIIEDELAEINRQMSTWDDESEITKFNRAPAAEWISVGSEFAIVVHEAQRLHALTGGAVDITVSPLIDLWGFGREKRQSLPTDQEIHEAQKSVGSQHLEVRLTPPALRKKLPQLQISVSCLAPGFAADEISRLLTEQGFPSHVVDIGGENRAGSAKHSGDPWRLGIESPLGGLQKVVRITDMAIATSGDYRSFFVAGKKKYSHILDPRTGRPVENPPASVSVLHQSCMTADGLATGMMVLGAEAGKKLAIDAGFDVYFQDLGTGEQLTEVGTGRFLDPE